MSLSITEFWSLVAQSRLLGPPECQRLAAEFAAQSPAAAEAAPLADWLVKRQIISPFHAKVLLAKRPGPFVYGDYKIVNRVDKGRLAGMFQALHQPTNHPVGLQFLSGAVAGDRDALARLTSRAAAASRLRHPCVWSCHQLADLGAFKFVVAAWHEGQSLEESLPKEKPLPPVEACRIARQTAHALAELHKAGLVHGAVRPANVWLDKAGHVKLLHAPLAAEPLPPSKQPADQVAAAADYLAPEIARDDRAADAAGDIYALGCLLYQLLCGRPPFAGGDAAGKKQRHATEAPAPLDKVNNTVPRALAQVVEQMLSKDPAARCKSAQIIIDALMPFVPPAKAGLPNEPLTAEAQAFEQFLKSPRLVMPPAAAPGSAQPMPVSAAAQHGNGHANPPAAQPMPAIARAVPAGQPGALPVAVAAAVGGPPLARAVPVGPTTAAMPQAVAVGAAPLMAAAAMPMTAIPIAAAPVAAAAPLTFDAGFSTLPEMSPAPGGFARRKSARRKSSNAILLVSIVAVLAVGGVVTALAWPQLFPPKTPDKTTSGTEVATTAVSADKPAADKPPGDKPKPGKGTKKPKPKNGDDADGDAGGSAAAGGTGDSFGAQSDPSTERLLGLEDAVWRTPTHGQPLELVYLPAGVKAAIALRPAEILKHAEGGKLIAGLGPLGELATNKLKALSGVPAEGIDQAIIGLLDAGSESLPSVAMVLQLTAAIDELELPAEWSNPNETTIGGTKVYVGQQATYYLPADGQGKLLAICPVTEEEKITEWLESTKQPPRLLQQMEMLRRATDSQRHFTFFFEPDFFVNGGGKALFSGPVERMKSPLVSFLSEGGGELPRAACFSAHLGDDLFMELITRGTANEESLVLAKSYRDRVGAFSEEYERYDLRLNPHDYGKLVLRRFPAMLKQMGYHTVAATDENLKLAILRCYLPAVAAHNLALATQLAVLETPGGAAAVSVAAGNNAPPNTLAERIKQKITLSFPRNTLEKCMELFGEEIGAPVEIIGGDLQLEGITKNQSFGLDEKDQPAVDILKKVLARSNPDGKLVYVIKEKNGKETLLITTRAAVAKRGDKLSADQEQPKK